MYLILSYVYLIIFVVNNSPGFQASVKCPWAQDNSQRRPDGADVETLLKNVSLPVKLH